MLEDALTREIRIPLQRTTRKLRSVISLIQDDPKHFMLSLCGKKLVLTYGVDPCGKTFSNASVSQAVAEVSGFVFEETGELSIMELRHSITQVIMAIVSNCVIKIFLDQNVLVILLTPETACESLFSISDQNFSHFLNSLE